MKKTSIVMLFLFSVAANASPVVWTVEGVLFDDGGTATGSFTYDADTEIFSDVSITTTPGSTLAGGFFDAADCNGAECSTADEMRIWPTGFGLTRPLMIWFFDGPLTNSGGSLHLLTINSLEYGDISGPSRSVVAGSITAVPVPAAFWLFGAALVSAGGMCRRLNCLRNAL